MNRNSWAALAATIAVIAVLILGFRVLGGPGTQRLVQSDLRTLRALSELGREINVKWTSSKVLPADLNNFPKTTQLDPSTGKPFPYRRKSDSEYELCSSFATDSQDAQVQNTDNYWAHPKGYYCFEFDASRQVPFVPYYY